MTLHRGLLVAAGSMIALAAATWQPEFVLPGLLLGAGSAYARSRANRRAIEASLAEVERRLTMTEAQLVEANDQLGQIQVEREFDRQLLRAEPPAEHPGS